MAVIVTIIVAIIVAIAISHFVAVLMTAIVAVPTAILISELKSLIVSNFIAIIIAVIIALIKASGMAFTVSGFLGFGDGGIVIFLADTTCGEQDNKAQQNWEDAFHICTPFPFLTSYHSI